MAGNKKEGQQKKKAIRIRYIANNTSNKNKVARVLQSQGVKAAMAFATKNNVIGHLHSLPLWEIKSTGKDHPIKS